MRYSTFSSQARRQIPPVPKEDSQMISQELNETLTRTGPGTDAPYSAAGTDCTTGP